MHFLRLFLTHQKILQYIYTENRVRKLIFTPHLSMIQSMIQSIRKHLNF